MFLLAVCNPATLLALFAEGIEKGLGSVCELKSRLICASVLYLMIKPHFMSAGNCQKQKRLQTKKKKNMKKKQLKLYIISKREGEGEICVSVCWAGLVIV